MKIVWQKKNDDETVVYLDGENSGYPIGICKRILSKKGFKWNIQPWFNILDIDQSILKREFDDDLKGGRALALLYNKIEVYRKKLQEEGVLEEIYFGDIIPFSGSD
jgi:hypothetical protein